MKKIIIDCDNTFGVCGCDLDDGLAIIYALGTGRCELLGVTATFGNNTLEVVYPNTVAFMKQIHADGIPVHPGHPTDAGQNEAARFLVETVNNYPGEIAILATGSLTNLYHAWRLEPAFFQKVPELSLMGGITEPLIIGGKRLAELNFSCDHEAAFHVLSKGRKIRIATGNHCMDALFSKERFDRLGQSGSPFLRWMHGQAQYWFQREKEAFGHDGIYKWDVYAAACLLYPELFDENMTEISPDLQSLKDGLLAGNGETRRASLPVLKDAGEYQKHVYEMYARFADKWSHGPVEALFAGF